MTIKAIIFDLDGTLIDSMGLWRQVDEEFLTSRGVAVPEDLFDNLPQGNSFIQTAQYFRDRFGLGESVEEIMQIWTNLVAEHYSNSIQLKAGAKQLLELLSQAHIQIGLATSNSYELARKALTFNGVWQHFACVSSGDMELRGKPFPDIFLNCARLLKLESSQCVAIEDTLSGVQAAQAAGMHTLAIYDEDSIRHHEQIRTVADAFCQNYKEVLQEIRKLRVEI
ncbi:MAG: HAD family phosphatase [Candidatus Cloacimonetes bacterium]|jgi:HAD superfamily hydrolase (TIGR01509 family)|nr:HAD family phosphatase [Candidatus Cloacimonadota bacterium]MDD2211319.1 HAD family phosphatase [Candidatus Cloacimonadota bacterium]MDD3282745.1 HAD family phosphatase [Candidatus Cloacimonadota bacterium]MDD4232406.1 HAD family phosphatase [Candidatus Cloacimonadota bacterium]MDY0299768.1 HAD family phosphatase [Candidatus Cloacimonadaceae bacterium]